MNEDLINAGLGYVQSRLAELEAKRARAPIGDGCGLDAEEIDELDALYVAEQQLIRQMAAERRAEEQQRVQAAIDCPPDGQLADWVVGGRGRVLNERRADAAFRGLARIEKALRSGSGE